MSRNLTNYTNNMEGLRRALFDQLQDLRDGISKPDEALAVAQIAGRILESARLELEMIKNEGNADRVRRKLKRVRFMQVEHKQGSRNLRGDPDISEPME